MRRNIQAFLAPQVVKCKYDYRQQWRQFVERFSAANSVEELSAAIVTGFCEVFGMGCGAIYIRNKSLGTYQLVFQLEMKNSIPLISLSDPFMAELSGVFIPTQESCSPESAITDMLKENRISIVIPLFRSDIIEGLILAGSSLHQPSQLNFEDHELILSIAHHSAAELSHRIVTEQMIQAREIEVLGKISTFMIHDLKNLSHTLSLITDNARMHISKPEFQQDMLVSLENTTLRMNKLITKFRNTTGKNMLHPVPTNLLKLSAQAATEIDGPEVHIKGKPVYALVDHGEFNRMLINLLVNAVDATFGRGPVVIEVGAADESAYVRVMDGGCGITEDFKQNQLFIPFKSTKKSGLGVGLYQSRLIAEMHDGRIEASSEFGKGSTFTVWLPLLKRSHASPSAQPTP